MPTFSIVVPTRARADTFRHALRSALAQTYADVEIIVQESGADALTQRVLTESHDPRLRAFRTVDPVRMTENWERALDHVRGDYIFFLGDDDGLLPDACAIASQFLQSNSVDILSWDPGTYCWPRLPDANLANRLRATYGEELKYTIKDSMTLLHLVYRFREKFERLPMIYNNSFVSRRVVDRVRAARGRYFFGSAPDVISGILNCRFADQFALCNRPLSIRGVSHNSTGYRCARSGDADDREQAFAAAFDTFVLHRTIPNAHHLPFALGSQFLTAKDELFPDSGPKFDYGGMLQEAGATINDLPGQYDAILELCRAIASAQGIKFDDSHVPPPGPPVPLPRLGRREISPGVISIDVDGRAHDIENVFDATQLLHKSLPACAGSEFALVAEHSPPSEIDLPANGAVALEFSLEGSAGHLLGSGWSYLDPSGVWSIGSHSEIALPLSKDFGGTCHLKVHGQMFLPPRALKLIATIDGRAYTHEHTASEAVVELDLGPIELRGSRAPHTLRLSVEVDGAISPAEAGMSDDARRLGIYLQRIVLLQRDTNLAIPD